MADPLSIVTGVAGLIQLAGFVIGQCYRYGCGVSSAPEEAKRLINEVTSLSGLLVGVQGVLKQSDPAARQFQDIVRDLRSLLQTISTRLKKQSPDSSRSSEKRILNRLLWPLRKAETEELVLALERQKTSLTLSLSSISLEMLIDHNTTLENLADSVAGLATDVKSNQAAQERRQVLDWLSDHPYDAQYKRGCQLHCLDTCSWLLYHPEFQAWTQKRSSLLWMNGQAGSGKTIATSYIINHLTQQAVSITTRIAYFYYDASTIESLTPETFFGAILKQLCAQMSEMPTAISSAYQRAASRMGTPKQATLEELETFLTLILEDQLSTIIVIDGLDESLDYSVVCDFLTSYVASGHYALRLFISSRPEVDLRRRLAQFQEIAVPESHIADDISLYIRMRIESDARLRRMSDEMKAYVECRLREDSHAMFRWVQCQLDAISRLRTDAAVKRALSQLPASLEGSYVRILQGIDRDDVGFARRTLLWLAYAASPLTLAELSQAVVLEPSLDSLDPHSMLNDPSDVLEICGGLVSFNTTSNTARIAHHSVREFLTQRLDSSSEFSIPARTSHRLIAEVCIAYLLLQDFDAGPLRLNELEWTLKNYPLLRYAAQNWIFHVEMSHAEAELQPLILRLMSPQPSPNFYFWLQVVLYDSKHGFIPPTAELTRARALYYAASYGMTETVRSLVSMGADLNERAGRFGGTALHSAVWRNRPEILRMLLRAGADLRLQDFNGSTPPELAMWNGNVEVLEVFSGHLDFDPELAQLMQRVLANHKGTHKLNMHLMSTEEWELSQRFQDMGWDGEHPGQEEPDTKILRVVNQVYETEAQADSWASPDKSWVPAVESTFSPVPRTEKSNARAVAGGEMFELDSSGR